MLTFYLGFSDLLIGMDDGGQVVSFCRYFFAQGARARRKWHDSFIPCRGLGLVLCTSYFLVSFFRDNDTFAAA